MDHFEVSTMDTNIWILFSDSSTTTFLHWVSASLHLFVLFVLSLSWSCKKSFMPTLENSKPMLKSTYRFNYWSTLISCVGLSFYGLLLCVLHSISGYRNGWSTLTLSAQFDFGFRSLTWFVIFGYLHNVASHSSEYRFPILLRIWWTFYFLLPCSSLVIHVGMYQKHSFVHFHLWISDGIFAIAGLFFCYIGLFGKTREDEDVHLSEPLIRTSSQRNDDNGQQSKVHRDSVSPYANANLLSIFTFSWISPLLALGNKKTLALEDVPQLDNSDRANMVFGLFKTKLEYDDKGNGRGGKLSTFKLGKALIISAWKEILWTALLSIICTLASYVGPYLIDAFVQYLSSRHQKNYKCYILVFIFFFSKLIKCLSERHLFFQLRKISIRVRAALFAIIYQKSLGLSNHSKQFHTSGENVNLMSVDVERISIFIWYLHNIWRVPVQVVLALLILYKSVGHASVVAFISTMILLFANIPLGKLQEKYQGKLMDSKDQRMKVTSEALRNIRILKLQGWDMKFLDQINDLRNFEAKRLKEVLFSSAVIAFVYLTAPMFVSMVTFGFCVLMEIRLESGKILSALATFEILQDTIYNVPNLISVVVQTKVSLNRITSFLCLDDLHRNIIQKLPGDSEVAIEIVKGNFSWNLHSHYLTLKEINFKVYHGMRVAICGSVGSGKSSLLLCILGEVPMVSGVVMLNSAKAYVAQSPWIQSGKIVDNILFGKEMDKERYNMILEACSLREDLKLFAYGDQTMIGERGTTLSGGQKQRIQIACALYHDVDIYLLDDPFSSVDAYTGNHLFKECLLGILTSKTVIYVTHQIDFLPSADLISVMRDGMITQIGTYEELLSLGTDFMELVGSHKKVLTVLNSMDNSVVGEEDANIQHNENPIQDDQESTPKNEKIEKVIQSKGQLIQEEKREKGGVGISVYWKYITASYKGAMVPMIILAQIFFQLLLIFSSYWMVLSTPISKDVRPHVKGSTLILVSGVLTLGSSFCVLIRSILIVTLGYKTTTLFFNKMHYCIFHAPMSFFDCTPSGRILDRASTDQNALDTSIPHQIEELLMSLIGFMGTVAAMSYIEWKMLVVFIPMTVICIWYQVTSRSHD